MLFVEMLASEELLNVAVRRRLGFGQPRVIDLFASSRGRGHSASPTRGALCALSRASTAEATLLGQATATKRQEEDSRDSFGLEQAPAAIISPFAPDAGRLRPSRADDGSMPASALHPRNRQESRQRFRIGDAPPPATTSTTPVAPSEARTAQGTAAAFTDDAPTTLAAALKTEVLDLIDSDGKDDDDVEFVDAACRAGDCCESEANSSGRGWIIASENSVISLRDFRRGQRRIHQSGNHGVGAAYHTTA